MEEALQKLKELKLKRHSEVSEEEDLEGSRRYKLSYNVFRRPEYEERDEENRYSNRDGSRYENSYRSNNERHSLVQQRGEESKQSNDN